MSYVCIKIGGSTIDTPGLLNELAVAILKVREKGYNVVVVHGGGKDIAKNLNRLNKEFSFVNGMRVTDEETMQTVQMVLSGDVNKRIVNAFLNNNLKATGISGVDNSTFIAEKLMPEGKDIGFVGRIKSVNTKIIDLLCTNEIIPVISPVSRGEDCLIYNVNADLAASELAIALKSKHLIFISDVAGVLKNGNVIHEISIKNIDEMIEDGTVNGGMIPKLRSAADAIIRGVENVHICSWKNSDTIINELSVKTATGSIIHR